MSTTILPAPSSPVGQTKPVVAANYTICAVFVASNVAAELGWLHEELKAVGADLRYILSLDKKIGFLPHFSHELENFFRDGGNIPSIWAKADRVDTTLLALTSGHPTGRLVVRVDSGIYRVADLKGKKVGLYKSLNTAKVDFRRGTSERAIELILALHGLSRADVQIVDIEHADDGVNNLGAAAVPSDRAKDAGKIFANIEAAALADRSVDAAFITPSFADQLEATGDYKSIEDLERHPDWTLKVANSPLALTVNTAFANEHPEVVVAYLRAAIRAGRWINANPAAASTILKRVVFSYDDEQAARVVANYGDFVPNLSAQNLAGIEIEKNFLLSHGYIRRDFDVKQWANPAFLEQALRSLDA